MDKLQVLSASSLAEVQTPTGAVWYVPRAKQHGDFLVQRRYVGSGSQHYSGSAEEGALYIMQERIVPVLVPYLNPEAVQAAGLDMSTIMTWSTQHPGRIFCHPTYAPLCLRWGDNAHGYVVAAQQQEPTLDMGWVPFTPYTCWLTGNTYYQVDPELEEGLFKKLLAQASLLPHEREVGLEGNWPGWYLTDIELAAKVLATTGHRVALACAHLCYGLWTYPAERGKIHWLNFHTTAEEALTLYQQLPESRFQTPDNVTAMWGCALAWPGRESIWNSVGEKYLPREYAVNLYQNDMLPHPNQVAVRQLFIHEVAEIEAPLMRRIITLTEYLNAARLSRWQVMQKLNWVPDKLPCLERHPWELTIQEVKQLAGILEVGEEELTTSIKHEMRAWEATEQHRNANRQKATKAAT